MRLLFDIPSLLKSRDDIANESTLLRAGLAIGHGVRLSLKTEDLRSPQKPIAYLDAIWLDSNESMDNCELHRHLNLSQSVYPWTLVLTSVRWTYLQPFLVLVYTCVIDEGELVFWR